LKHSQVVKPRLHRIIHSAEKINKSFAEKIIKLNLIFRRRENIFVDAKFLSS
jgi:hypothetical protein